MKIINRDRGSGKTTMLIHTAYITGYTIIVKDNQRVEQIESQAKNLGCDGINVISYEELRTCIPRHLDGILIDEATDFIEMAFEHLFNGKIEACTMTVPIDCERRTSEIDTVKDAIDMLEDLKAHPAWIKMQSAKEAINFAIKVLEKEDAAANS